MKSRKSFTFIYGWGNKNSNKMISLPLGIQALWLPTFSLPTQTEGLLSHPECWPVSPWSLTWAFKRQSYLAYWEAYKTLQTILLRIQKKNLNHLPSMLVGTWLLILGFSFQKMFQKNECWALSWWGSPIIGSQGHDWLCIFVCLELYYLYWVLCFRAHKNQVLFHV